MMLEPQKGAKFDGGPFFGKAMQLARQKPLITVIVVLAVAALVIALFTSSNGSTSEEVLRKFQNAVAAEDVDALKELISVDDQQMEVKTEYLGQFIKYAKEHPKYLNQTMEIMIAQQALHENAENINTGLLDQHSPAEVLGAGEFYLKKESGLFSDSYAIGVRPQYLEITLENDNGIVKVNTKEIMKASKDNHTAKLGPLFPGEYDVSLVTHFDYANQDITQNETVSLFGFEPVTEGSYFITGDQVQITSSLDGVEVYVNDKPTPFVLGDEDSEYFYPAFSNGSQTIQGVAKFPWGESRSEAVSITNLSDSYSLTPPLLDQTKQEVLAFVRQFLETRAKSYEAKDISALQKMYHSSYGGDILQETQKKLGALHHFASISDYTLKAVTLKEASFGYREDPLEHVSVSYDHESKRFVVEIDNMYTLYALTMSDGRVDDTANQQMLDIHVTYENGKWVVLRIL
ncbi:MAG: rane protein-like protein [Brevibacillus sp.]|nr:rane protein-like protein [Brevibacillus sp.]